MTLQVTTIALLEGPMTGDIHMAEVSDCLQDHCYGVVGCYVGIFSKSYRPPSTPYPIDLVLVVDYFLHVPVFMDEKQ